MGFARIRLRLSAEVFDEIRFAESHDRIRPARGDPRPLRETVAVALRTGQPPSRNPIRYLQRRGQPAARHRRWQPSRVSFSRHRAGRRVFLARAAYAAGRNARRRLSVRAEHRPPAASVAHHDQDRQGRDTEQAEPRSVRRDASRRCRGAGRRGRDRSKSARAVGVRCCRPSVTDRVRPGTVSRRSTGTTSLARIRRSTPSPTTRSTRFRSSPNSSPARSRCRASRPNLIGQFDAVTRRSSWARRRRVRPTRARHMHMAPHAGTDTTAAPLLSDTERIYLGGYLAALDSLPLQGHAHAAGHRTVAPVPACVSTVCWRALFAVEPTRRMRRAPCRSP